MQFIIIIIIGFLVVMLLGIGYLLVLSFKTTVKKEPVPVVQKEIFNEDNWLLAISTKNEPYLINGDSIIYDFMVDSISIDSMGDIKIKEDETTVYFKINRELSVFKSKNQTQN